MNEKANAINMKKAIGIMVVGRNEQTKILKIVIAYVLVANTDTNTVF
jgi:hypothetical protein